MKPVGRFSKLIGYTFLISCSALASANAVEKGKAVVRAVRGNAQYNLGSGYKPVSVGMQFPPQTVIRTAPDSQVDLFLGDNGPVVRTTPDTELGLDKLTIDNVGAEKIIETQLNLKSGRILGNVKKMAAASRYEVKTPRGIAGIRGTEYDIRADGTVSVISGTVVMAYTGTSVVTVNAGQTSRPPAPGQQGIATPDANIRPLPPELQNMPPVNPPNVPIPGLPVTPAPNGPQNPVSIGDVGKPNVIIPPLPDITQEPPSGPVTTTNP
jgi:hypothetical protein